MKTTNDFITDYDLHLLSEGTHYRSWEKLGAHIIVNDKEQGASFAVWAPNASAVSVVGEFNLWQNNVNSLTRIKDTGYWYGFIQGVGQGALYKYAITSKFHDFQVEKTDPFAFHCEIRPATASVVWDLGGYEWHDEEWMKNRGERHRHTAPISIYELHLGSWMRT